MAVSETKIVGIHQPNFLPWLGYFNKIARSDIFIFLDDTQYSKQSYTGRTKLKVGDKAKWLNIPFHYQSGVAINDAALKQDDWKKNHLETLKNYYRKAKHFQVIFDFIESNYTNSKSETLSNFNSDMIKAICAGLNLTTPLVCSSDLKIDGFSDERLRKLIKAVNGTAYLSGSGGANYQSDEAYKQENINLIYSGFKAIEYPQLGNEFIPGLSILDALFNLGWEQTQTLVRDDS